MFLLDIWFETDDHFFSLNLKQDLVVGIPLVNIFTFCVFALHTY